MSVSKDVKDLLTNKIAALSTVQAVYGYEELNPSGWPCVWVRPSNLEGTFATSVENKRVYAYKVTAILPLGEDFIKDSSVQREEYAENVLGDVVDQIINYVDDTTFIAQLNAIYSAGDNTVLYVDAADAQWGEIDMQKGKAKAIQVSLLINTDYNTRT